jgi:uncharacterized protein YndB with AHSA1/START domain
MNAFGTIAHTGTIRFERRYPVSTERIWSYLTRPELLSTWLADCELELRVGGYVELHFDAQTVGLGHARSSPVISGVVTRCQPPDSLAFYWTDAMTISNVIFELERRGSDVLLLLTHAKLPRSVLPLCSASWHAHLQILEEQLQNRPSSSFRVVYQSVRPHYERTELEAQVASGCR